MLLFFQNELNETKTVVCKPLLIISWIEQLTPPNLLDVGNIHNHYQKNIFVFYEKLLTVYQVCQTKDYIYVLLSQQVCTAAVEGQPQVINQPDNSSCNELPPVMNTISFYCSAEPSYSPSRNVLSVFHGTFSHFLNEGENAELYSLFRCVFSVQTKIIQKTTYILGQASSFRYVLDMNNI